MNPPYGAVHGHCRELVALRRDMEALEQRYLNDMAKLQEQLDAERQARQTLDRRVQWNEHVAA